MRSEKLLLHYDGHGSAELRCIHDKHREITDIEVYCAHEHLSIKIDRAKAKLLASFLIKNLGLNKLDVGL